MIQGGVSITALAKEKSSWIHSLTAVVAEHPFYTLIIMCIACVTITGEQIYAADAAVPCFFILAVGIFASLYVTEGLPKKSRPVLFGVLAVFSVFFALLFGIMLTSSQKPELVVLNAGIPVVIAAAVYLAAVKKLDSRKLVILIFIAGFVIRLAYIIAISIKTKQHDVGSVERMSGHLGYIAHLTYYNSLPDIDVRTVNQFYHPPLHHMIAAFWVKLQTGLGIRAENIWENIQLLTMFYSCSCMILSYKLFRLLGLKGRGLVFAFAAVAFCPTFYIMGGSINNDMLCVTFMLGAAVNALHWYKSRSFGRIMCTSVCVGCAMMAKLSGWMVAPAIAFIFIFAFFRDLRHFKKYIGQFAAFLGVCAPLGLWWGIRNYITHRVPITYIMELSEGSGQYIGDIPVMQRLFDFRPFQFADVGDQFVMYHGKYNEYNPLVALFKTSMFDEAFTVRYYPSIAGANKVLFWMAVILGIVGFAAMIYTYFFDKKLSLEHKLFTALLYTVILGSYYIFCITFPQVCTENIRYAVPVIVIGAYFVGRLVMNLASSKNEKTQLPQLVGMSALTAVMAAYCVMSVLVYDIAFITA